MPGSQERANSISPFLKHAPIMQLKVTTWA